MFSKKKILLITVLSAVFIFGVFSYRLAAAALDPEIIAIAEGAYADAIAMANMTYDAAIATAQATRVAAEDAAHSDYEIQYPTYPIAAQNTYTAALENALAAYNNDTAIALAAYNNAAAIALAAYNAIINPTPPPPSPSPPPSNQSQPTPAPADPNVVNLENPIGIGQKGTTEATQIIATVIKTALGIIGALTLLMLVYGGFQWLTSAGNPEKVKMGTQTMVWAIIGVILVFASYMLLSTFLNYLTGKA